MTPLVALDQQVKQACPKATGVSIGRWDDKTTWRVTGPVTPSEASTVAAIFAGFDKDSFEASQPPVLTLEQRVKALEDK